MMSRAPYGLSRGGVSDYDYIGFELDKFRSDAWQTSTVTLRTSKLHIDRAPLFIA